MIRVRDYWESVPRKADENVAFRGLVLDACRYSRAKRRAVLKACAEDIFFWIDTFVWQFNPKSVGEASRDRGPFVTWPYQQGTIRELNWCIDNQSDAVIEKSRDSGASWLCSLTMMHQLIFSPKPKKYLFVSRNEDMVDKTGDSDSLFWKFDYVFRHLPEWMAEVGPGKMIARKTLLFANNFTDSMITGAATTEKMGVGGRANAMFLDEFPQMEKARTIYDNTSDTAACRIFNGTHKGVNTMFAELCANVGDRYSVRKIVMHWSMHPDKSRGLYHFDPQTQQVVYHDPSYEYPADFTPVTDGKPLHGPFPGLRSPWYDKQCQRKGSDRAIAADLDISASGTQEQVFDAGMIAYLQNTYAKDPAFECDLAYGRADATPERLYPEAGGLCHLWHRLDQGEPPPGKYVFGADIANGTGATPSCLCGFNVETQEKVFEYVNARIEPKEFAYFAAAVVRLYASRGGQPAMLGWETPGPGTVFGKHILAIGLRNIFYRYTEHRLNKKKSETPGWVNAPDSMLNLIINYRDALRSKKLLNRSRNALSECLAFVYAPDGYVYHTGWKDPRDNSAATINHGDRVVADALCWKMIEDMNLPQNRVKPQETEPEASVPGGLAWRRQMDKMGRKHSWA